MSEKTDHTVKILKTDTNRVTFTLINQFIEECYIYIKEPKSGLTIYSTFMTLKPGISHYIEIGGATSRWVKNAILEVEKDGILKQSIEFQFRDGKDRSIIVNSKKQNINCNKEDGAYNTVAEIFFSKTYEKDYVKVEVGDVIVDVGANLGLFSLYAQSSPVIVFDINSLSNRRALAYFLKTRGSPNDLSVFSTSCLLSPIASEKPKLAPWPAHG